MIAAPGHGERQAPPAPHLDRHVGRRRDAADGGGGQFRRQADAHCAAPRQNRQRALVVDVHQRADGKARVRRQMRQHGEVVDLDLQVHRGQFRGHSPFPLERSDEGKAGQGHILAAGQQLRDRIRQAGLVEGQPLGTDEFADDDAGDVRRIGQLLVEGAPLPRIPEALDRADGQLHLLISRSCCRRRRSRPVPRSAGQACRAVLRARPRAPRPPGGSCAPPARHRRASAGGPRSSAP